MGRRSIPHDEVSDDALLAGIALGDDDAVVAFVRRYQRRLFGLAFTILDDRDAAEDVTQEAFIRVLRHAAHYDARRASVSTWCLTITRHLAIDALRLRRAIPTAPHDLVFARLTSDTASPEDAVGRAEAATPAWAALRQLPLEQRRCVVLAAVYGRTAAEIAMSESIPLGTAKSRLRLGLARLRDLVGQEST